MAVVDDIFAKVSVQFDFVKSFLSGAFKYFESPRPDEKMLESLYQLLEFADRKPDPMLVLTPTTVVHTFCRLHADCSENEIVKRFIVRLEERVQKSLATNLMKRSNRETVNSSSALDKGHTPTAIR